MNPPYPPASSGQSGPSSAPYPVTNTGGGQSSQNYALPLPPPYSSQPSVPPVENQPADNTTTEPTPAATSTAPRDTGQPPPYRQYVTRVPTRTSSECCGFSKLCCLVTWVCLGALIIGCSLAGIIYYSHNRIQKEKGNIGYKEVRVTEPVNVTRALQCYETAKNNVDDVRVKNCKVGQVCKMYWGHKGNNREYHKGCKNADWIGCVYSTDKESPDGRICQCATDKCNKESICRCDHRPSSLDPPASSGRIFSGHFELLSYFIILGFLYKRTLWHF